MSELKCLNKDCSNCNMYNSSHGWYYSARYGCYVMEYTCFDGTYYFNEKWERLN